MHPTIHYLENKNLLWRANYAPHAQQTAQDTGFEELNQALQGGFPEHGVVDIHTPIGIGELRLLLPSLLTKQQSGSGVSVFISPPLTINSEMLAEQNFDLDKVIIIQPESGKDILWSTEQCLKSGVCHSIVIWHNHLSVAQVKRLQLAAEQGNSLLFILRSSPTKHVSLPVTLGLTLNPAKAGIKIHITKRRGTWPSAAININMQAKWPELCKPEISQRNKAKVIDFPSQIHCVS